MLMHSIVLVHPSHAFVACYIHCMTRACMLMRPFMLHASIYECLEHMSV